MKSDLRIKLFSVLIGLFAFLPLIPSASAAITVDGLMSDWGVTPGAFGASDWVPTSDVFYVEEDQNPAVDFLSPGWGGQNFDAEALYFKKEGMTAYFALVTGFPASGYSGERFGDLAFDFDSDGTFEFGVETKGEGSFVKKHLYGNATWVDPTFVSSKPYNLKTGVDKGLVSFAYNQTTYVANKHYVVEIGIPISLFGSFWSDPNGNPEFTFHWTMSCGNDVIDLHVPKSSTAVPEPATMALMSLGLAGYGLVRRKRVTA